MYRTLTDPKLLRRLPHSRVILNYIISNLHGSFLNVIFQKNPPANIVFTMYAGEKKVMLISRYFSASISALFLYLTEFFKKLTLSNYKIHTNRNLQFKQHSTSILIIGQCLKTKFFIKQLISIQAARQFYTAYGIVIQLL